MRELNPDQHERKCPECAEYIKVEARTCRYCGHEIFKEEVEKHIGEAKSKFEEEKGANNSLILWGSFAVGIFLLLATGYWLIDTPQLIPATVESATSEGAMWRGNVQRSGAHSAPGPSFPLRRKWRFIVDGEYTSSPTATEETVYFGSHKYLHAIDAETGDEEWRFETGEHVYAPTKAGGAVYFGSDDYLYAIDAQSGDEEWRFEVKGEFVSGSPVVVDGTVYVGGSDGYLYAVDAQFGGKEWRYKTGDVVESPALANGVVYFGSWDEHIYAVDAETGQEQWNLRTGGSIHAIPAVTNGSMYAGSKGGRLYAISLETNSLQWHFQIKTHTNDNLIPPPEEVTVASTMLCKADGGLTGIQVE